jgi:hypothetical protein
MDHATHQHIAQALDFLEVTSAQPPARLSADELVIALSEVAAIAGLLGQLAAQTRQQLAAWATVGAHLQQAEQHAENLSRSLKYACGTFAFATSPPTAA